MAIPKTLEGPSGSCTRSKRDQVQPVAADSRVKSVSCGRASRGEGAVLVKRVLSSCSRQWRSAYLQGRPAREPRLSFS